MTLTELFTSIANTIRSKNYDAPEKIKAVNFPEEIATACNASEVVGFNIGLEQGREEGKQEEHDRVWDAITCKGTRTDYRYAFADWNTYGENLRPTYVISPSSTYGCNSLFYNCEGITKIEKGYFDFSHLTNDTFSYAFSSIGTLLEIEDIGLNTANSYNSSFLGSYNLKKIAKITSYNTTKYNSAFNNCSGLEEVVFEGVIANSINFPHSSKLTLQTLRNILTTLTKDSTYASGKVITFNTASKAVIEADTICSEQLALAVSVGWTIAYNS